MKGLNEMLNEVVDNMCISKSIADLNRQNAASQIAVLSADPRSQGLNNNEVTRRADLMFWFDKNSKRAQVLDQKPLVVFFRPRAQTGHRRTPEFAWRQGEFLDFDSAGFNARIRTVDSNSSNVVEVVNPDDYQIVTQDERHTLRLRAALRATVKDVTNLLDKINKIEDELQTLEHRIDFDKAQVTAALEASAVD